MKGYAVFNKSYFVRFDTLEKAFAFAGENFEQIKGTYEDGAGNSRISVPVYRIEDTSVMTQVTLIFPYDCDSIKSGKTPSQVIAERRMATKFGECNPCYHCQHLYDDSDESVGYYGYGCDEGEEWDADANPKSPCPYFRARLSSDSLYEQLADEWEYQMIQDEEEEHRKEMEGEEE